MDEDDFILDPDDEEHDPDYYGRGFVDGYEMYDGGECPINPYDADEYDSYDQGYYDGWYDAAEGYDEPYYRYIREGVKNVKIAGAPGGMSSFFDDKGELKDRVGFRQYCFQTASQYGVTPAINGMPAQREPIGETLKRAAALENYFLNGATPEIAA